MNGDDYHDVVYSKYLFYINKNILYILLNIIFNNIICIKHIFEPVSTSLLRTKILHCSSSSVKYYTKYNGCATFTSPHNHHHNYIEIQEQPIYVIYIICSYFIQDIITLLKY